MGSISAVFNAIVASIFGVVGFAVVKEFLRAQDQSNWSAAEVAILNTATPIALALITFVLAFSGVSALRGRS